MTLHVGLGTFRPVKEEEITDHEMHSEYCMISAETAETINRTKREGGGSSVWVPPLAAPSRAGQRRTAR